MANRAAAGRPRPRSRRRWSGLAIVALAALLVAPTGPALAATGFSDVPDDHPFAEDITWMADRGIAQGLADGTFGTVAPVSRQAMAAFFHRLWLAIGEAEPQPLDPGAEPSFTDVPPGHPFHADIVWMARLEITTGYDDGSFRPGAPVSRQAMAAFLHRLWSSLDEPDPVLTPDPGFSDVPQGAPFFDDVAWLAEVELTTGHPSGRFEPLHPVARQSMAAFLHRLWLASGYVVDDDGDSVDAAPGDGICADADGACTLRAAIDDANARPGRQTIRILPGIHTMLTRVGTDEVNAVGDLDLHDDLRILGRGGIVDAAGVDRVIEIYEGDIELQDLTVTGGSAGHGAGIFHGSSTTAGTLDLVGVTITGNHAIGSGGGVYSRNNPALTIARSTIAGNSADSGGGLDARSATTIAGSTIADNEARDGAAIYVSTTSDVQVLGSLLSALGTACSRPITSTGHNAGDDDSCGLDDPTDQVATDLLIGTLADNGGPTSTMLPAADSLAIDAVPIGTPLLCDAGAADQRGIRRPVGGACDIGATEGAGPPSTPLALVVDSADDVDDAVAGDGRCDVDGGTVEPGDCTLRAAISEANANIGPDEVTVADGIEPMLAIEGPDEAHNATGDLDVRDSLTLDLRGATVDAAGIDRVLDHHGRALVVRDGALTGGRAPAGTDGGGLRHLSGWLTVDRVTISGNVASAGGGVAAVSGPTTIVDSELSDNRAEGGGGGGLASLAPTSIVGSTFTGNEAVGTGTCIGGSGVRAEAPIQVHATTIHANTTTCTGGGIVLDLDPDDVATVIASTITDNTAALSSGRAIHQTGGTAEVGGSIIDGDGWGCVGTFVSLGYNRAKPRQRFPATRPCLTPAASPGVGDDDATGVDLGPLADNGGPTRTRLPAAGSTAIDVIPVGAARLCDASLPADQRGEPRPLGTSCDVGAVEQQAAAP